MIIFEPKYAPMNKAKANTQPLIAKEGMDEKKAPIVHPIARPAPYPINIPPKNDCRYLFNDFDILNLNSSAKNAPENEPMTMPALRKK